MKRLHVLPFLAALILVLCYILPTKAEAATSGYYTYTVSNGKATITDCDTSISGDVIIPSTLGGYPVTSIGNSAFFWCSSLTSVTIPDSVTSIGSSAFSGCSSLTGITIPDSVTSIGYSAFDDCSRLTSITIPGSVTSIGRSAFSGCSSLTGIWVDTDNKNYSSDENGVLFNKEKTTLIEAPGAIITYTIPDSVTSIGGAAFEDCRSLTSITIPDGVTSIGSSAFYNCISLTSVTIPDSVTSIGSSAFYNCSSLTYHTYDNAKYLGNEQNPHMALVSSTSESITSCEIHAKTKIIADGAFSDCHSLSSVTIPDSVTSIGNYAFYKCNSLTSITIPDSVTSVGEYAFYYCTSLTRITIPNSVTSIGSSAFFYCNSLGSVTIPDSITYISSSMFEACRGLASITIPDSVTSIGSSAFYKCSSLTSITIPDSVTSIGDYAFRDCSSLDHVAYTGTQAQWAAVTVGLKSEALTGVPNFHYETTFENIDTCAQTGIYCPVCQVLISGTTWTSSNPNPNVPHQIVAATCTEPETCMLCSVTVGEPLGHSGENWDLIQENSCTQSGLRSRICEVCGAKETQEIPIAAHTYGDFVVTLAPTCLDAGSKARICTICGNVDIQTVAPLRGEVLIDPTLYPYPESSHNYPNNVNETKTFTYPGAEKLTITFSVSSVTESNYDKVYIYDANGSQLAVYTGSLSGKTLTITGDTFKVKLTSDGSVQKWGYSFSSIVANMGNAHTWGDWAETTAPTCTDNGVETRVCSYCNLQEARVGSDATGHSYVNGECTDCGRSEYFRLVLTKDTQVDLGLEQDLYVDLNGFDLSGTIITNGYKVYGKDSTTDSYSCENMGSFTCVDENGDFIVPERIYTEGEKQYMAICEEDRYSFHRFFAGITHMTLAPETVGLGYKTAVYGDEMVFSQLDAFTFQVQLEGYNPVYRHFGSSELASGDPITLRIRNYDVENYSEHNLYAQVSLTLNDGTVIETEQVALTFRWLTEQIDANYTNYTEDQIALFKELLEQFEIVKTWNLPTLFPAAVTSAALNLSDTANRLSQNSTQQIWAANGITLTNNKHNSSAAIANYAPIRLYAGTEVIIDSIGMIQLEFDCTGINAKYVTSLYDSLCSISGATVTQEGTTITVVLSTAADRISFVMTAQGRAASLTVQKAG